MGPREAIGKGLLSMYSSASEAPGGTVNTDHRQGMYDDVPSGGEEAGASEVVWLVATPTVTLKVTASLRAEFLSVTPAGRASTLDFKKEKKSKDSISKVKGCEAAYVIPTDWRPLFLRRTRVMVLCFWEMVAVRTISALS